MTMPRARSGGEFFRVRWCMRRVCVFCGSRPGGSPSYEQAARELGRTLADAGMGVVYGGASVGCMGAVADSALDAGGEVIGVIPGSMVDRELAHKGLTELIVVESMLERKQIMADKSDAFVALAGGVGTLDELFEMLTWRVLNIQDKPIVLVNTEGYYDDLIAFLDRAVTDDFLRPQHRDLLEVADEVASVLELLGRPQKPAI